MKPFWSVPTGVITLGAASMLLSAGIGWAAPSTAPGYQIEALLPGSPFCGVHGLGVDSEDRLYAGSVVGQRIYRVNINDGSVSTEVGPPKGMADDMEFLPDGTLVWTSISQNAVRARKPGGEIVDLATNLASVNSIAYRETDNRLFVAQVFGGDGLWELDPAGEKPRRSIRQDMGGLNGFDIGPDGMIYGPLWFKQQVVKIDPDSGNMTVIADGFHTPAAANFDSKGKLYVLDTGTGEVFRVNIETGDKTVIAELKTSLDNLAIDSRDNIYVSNMADNAIHRIDTGSGEVSEVVKSGLSCSTALSSASDENGETLYLADIFALRAIDSGSGSITDIGRAHAADTHIAYPTYVSASNSRVYAISAEGMQVYNRQTHTLLHEWNGIRSLQQVIELADGDLLALSGRGTRLTRLNGENYEQQDLIASNLERIGAMVQEDNNSLYVSQPGLDRVASIDLNSGELQVVSNRLDSPQGLDLSPGGKLIVMESSGRVLALQLADSNNASVSIETLAMDIPVGAISAAMGIQSPGLTVGKDGTIYALSDRENTVYRISKE